MITKNLIGRKVTILNGENVEGNAVIKDTTDVPPILEAVYDDCKIWSVYAKVKFANEPHENYLRWVRVAENRQTGICDPMLYENGKAIFSIPNTIV